jgi:hypothetical protein
LFTAVVTWASRRIVAGLTANTSASAFAVLPRANGKRMR